MTKILCVCGRAKDKRSKGCSICSNRSFPVDGAIKPGQSDEDIAKVISNSSTIIEAARVTGMKRSTIKKKIDTLGLDTSHMQRCSGRPYEAEQIFVLRGLDGPKNYNIRRHYSDLSPTEYICSECKMEPEWNGKTLTLQLHHKNGNNRDDRLENLCWLCPNCHSQTSNFVGKNSKKA